MSGILILGTGLAGYTVAREFRKLDTTTPLTLVTRDAGSFYSKPVLSNALAQNKTASQIALNSANDMARQLMATVHPHVTVTALDAMHQSLSTDGGLTLAGDQLVLALGADPIRLPLAGNAADRVLSVNDLDDYARFRDTLQGRKRVVILGAGLIGCEFANDLRTAGIEVALIDPAPQPLGRLLPPRAAAFLRSALENSGVKFYFGTTAQSVDTDGNALRVALARGDALSADLVLSAIGLRARTDLARAAGLQVNRGIVVNTPLQTSVDNIFALGDCAEVDGLHLPFVMPLMQQARALAKTLAGTPTAVQYPAMPVVVKTPACPTVVCPPPVGVEGQWLEESGPDGVRALYHDHTGALRGFALTGAAVKDKQALTRDVPNLL